MAMVIIDVLDSFLLMYLFLLLFLIFWSMLNICGIIALQDVYNSSALFFRNKEEMAQYRPHSFFYYMLKKILRKYVFTVIYYENHLYTSVYSWFEVISMYFALLVLTYFLLLNWTIYELIQRYYFILL